MNTTKLSRKNHLNDIPLEQTDQGSFFYNLSKLGFHLKNKFNRFTNKDNDQWYFSIND